MAVKLLVSRLGSADGEPLVPVPTPQGVGAPSRADLARQALQAAEAKTGVVSQQVRSIDTARARPGQVVEARQIGELRQVGELRQESEARQAEGPSRPDGGELDAKLQTSAEVASYVAAQLEPGFTVSVEGSNSVLFAVAAALWGPSTWGALAGLPDAGLLAASQAGIPLERTVVIPDLGPNPLPVIAALIDSRGLIMAGPLNATPADRRRIEARIRHRRTHLIVAGPWPGARLAVSVKRVVRDGIGRGDGTLGEASLSVSVRSRVHELWREAAG